LFNVAGYWRRKSQGKVEDEGWYLLTNLETHNTAISAFKSRMGIEASSKIVRQVVTTSEKSHANNERLQN
jgi:ribosomal protein S6